MKQKHVLWVAVSFLLTISAGSARPAGDRAPVIVSADWLASHLTDPNLVVLNVASSIRDYRKGHIPGARFLWIDWVAASNPELSFELVPLKQLDTLFEGLGVSNDSRIILCGVRGNVSATARTYVTLDYLGMGDRTSILDGGFEEWKAAGHPVSQDSSSHKRGSFTPHLNRDAIVNIGYVQSHLHASGTAIVDARSAASYKGTNASRSQRAGHIPGARNVVYSTLFDSTDRYLPPDSLKARFDSAGVDPSKDVITYCYVGQAASCAYVAAKILGHAAHLYDGSFDEWGGRDDLPLESEAQKDSSKAKANH